MSYEPKVGDAVIMLHPHFDRYIVVFIAKVTGKMAGIHYLDRYGNLVTSDTSMRMLKGIIGKLRDDISMAEAQTALRAEYEIMTAAQATAKTIYKTAMKSLIKGDN